MDPTKLDTPITVPTDEEQEQVVGGASGVPVQHGATGLSVQRKPNLVAPPDETNRAIPARWDPHPPILSVIAGK